MFNVINYHLVCFACAGKSTFAKELEARHGFVRISIDDIKWQRGFRDTGDDDMPDKAWGRVFREADELLSQYLQAGRPVANEYAWVTRYWCERSKSAATAVGADTIFVHLQVPEVEIRRRWLENAQSKVRFHMPEGEFNRMFHEFEPLQSDKLSLIYDGSCGVDQWVAQNMLARS